MFHHVLLLLLMIFRVRRFQCPLTVGRSVALCVSWIHNGEILADKNLIQQKTLTTNEELHKLAAYAENH